MPHYRKLRVICLRPLSDAALDHGDAADLIWQHLADRDGRWLLVIDNADDPQALAGDAASVADGRGWLRPLTTSVGTVLVTSRDASPGSWGSWCHGAAWECSPPTRPPGCWSTTQATTPPWAATTTPATWPSGWAGCRSR
jgi:hypothetical protein